MSRRLLLAAVLVALGALTGGAHASTRQPARHPRSCAPAHRLRCTRPVRRRHRHPAHRAPASARLPASAPAAATAGGDAGTGAGSPDPGVSPSDPAAALPPGSTPGPSPAPAPAPARLQISAREYALTLSRPQIVAGPAVLEFLNGGQDPHDLHARPASGGADVGSFAPAAPGSRSDQRFTFGPGSYTLYCSIPGHEALGMRVTLIVN